MQSIADEILSYYGTSNSVEDDELLHYGVLRRSGRYPYGSGKNAYQHGRDFLGRIEEYKKNNFTCKDENGNTLTGEKAIAYDLGINTSDLRKQISWANYERRLLDVQTAKSLKEDGLGYTEIGRKMGMSESTIRSLLNPKSEGNMQQTMNTVNFLADELEKKGMLDVGADVARELNISEVRLNNALDYMEKAMDCPVYSGGIPQVTNKGKQTTQRVLCMPGTKHSEIYDLEKVHTITDYITRDGGQTFEKKFHYPTSIDSKRVKVLLKEEIGPDGEPGVAKDGIIQIRRGVPDLSLGESRYAQVRILVDGDKYLKGMAVYSDNMPDGYDIVFNSNKKSVEDAYKKIKNDPDNPFGSAIKDANQGGQYWYDADTGQRCSANDPNVKNKKLGAINKRADEGDWDEWADALPSQFLGKQSKAMARKQLDLAKADKLAEYEEYCSITNPTIKKHMLEKFADSCDSAAVHLKAAALPGQKYHVIIPINTLKDTEVYAPNYENGTKLALIRYPHGGTFEIPILTVNNKHKAAKNLLGTDIIDAVGINAKVAERLSGADFDGDTVMCIPTHDPMGKVKISSKNELEDLKGFDSRSYQYDKMEVDADGNEHYYRNGQEFKTMGKRLTQKEMGVISNLITDMTLSGGATDAELARAVKHSMVVIDAEKHKLDYKASEIENNIAGLKKKYQIRIDEDGVEHYGGAGTLLSRAKGETTVDKRQGSYKINVPGTPDYDPTRPDGAKLWKKADDLYYADRKQNPKTGLMVAKTADGGKVTYDPKNKEEYDYYYPRKETDPDTGATRFYNKDKTIEYKAVPRTQPSTKMAEADDAYKLVSTAKHPMELIYADFANDMKNLGNQARLEMVNTGKIAVNKSAKNTYKEEIKSLEEKLDNALLNSPRERHAQRLANIEIEAKKAKAKADGAEMTNEEIKKASQQAISKYRTEVGATRRRDRNIPITDREWEAIQAGAVSETTLKKILNNTDIDELRERATPRSYNSLTSAQINRAKAMSASNYTLDEIAKKLGVSTSTVSKYIKSKGAN